MLSSYLDRASYLKNLGYPSLISESFSQLRNFQCLLGLPSSGAPLLVVFRKPSRKLGAGLAFIYVPCHLFFHQMSLVLCFSYNLLYFLTLVTWFARHEILMALHFSFPPSLFLPPDFSFPSYQDFLTSPYIQHMLLKSKVYNSITPPFLSTQKLYESKGHLFIFCFCFPRFSTVKSRLLKLPLKKRQICKGWKFILEWDICKKKINKNELLEK